MQIAHRDDVGLVNPCGPQLSGATVAIMATSALATPMAALVGCSSHFAPKPCELVATFQPLPNLAFGIGANSGFSAVSHQYSNSVLGKRITPAGTFKNLYFWTSGSPIQFFE